MSEAWKQLFPGKTPEDAQAPLVSGMRIFAAWPMSTPLPLESKLLEAVAPFGTPWRVDSVTDVQHVGVDLTEDTTILKLEVALNAAAGHAPALYLVPNLDSLDVVIGAEKNWDALKETAKDASNTLGSAVDAAATVAKWAVWAPLVIGGALVVGGLVYLGWKASKERKS